MVLNPLTPFCQLQKFQLHSQEVVQAIMKFCSNDLCILSGKGPGAARALDAAAKGGTDATVAACLLFAPAPPAPERCGYEGPVMRLGSRGESSAIGGILSWGLENDIYLRQ